MYYIETETNLLNFRKKEMRKLPISRFGVKIPISGHLQKQYMESVYGSPMPMEPDATDLLDVFENKLGKNKLKILDRMFLRKPEKERKP
jgi:hypothetical protein